ncbi:MAG: hypothetical protein V3W41_02070 [Planctomycetota bacterium]
MPKSVPCCSKTALVALVLAGCRAPGGAPTHAKSEETFSDSADTTAGSSSGEAEDVFDKEQPFWDAIWISADWNEYHPTLMDMAESADVVCVGNLSRVVPGKIYDSEDPNIFLSEANVEVNITESIRGGVTGGVTFSVLLTRAQTEEAFAMVLKEMNAAAPKHVLLALRKRPDFPDLYTPVNGYALWAKTKRDPYDNPLTPDSELESRVYADELLSIPSFEALIDVFRP